MTISIDGKAARRKALIIGISDYTNLPEDLQLHFCRNDGIKMCKLLESQKYDIAENNMLVGEAKWEKVRKTIHDFFVNNDGSPYDTLLFYYSGHGMLDDRGDTYLALSDTDPNDPYLGGYSFEDLTKMIEKTKSTRVIVILDCCYSGSIKKGKGSEKDAARKWRRTMEGKLKNLQQQQQIHVKCILAASQSHQEAYAKGEHSVFTEYLLKGLEGDDNESIDNEGNVTTQLLGQYVYNAIESLPSNKKPNQDPIIITEGSANIILASYPDRRKSKDTASASEVIVDRGILASKSKILIAVGIAAVVAVVLMLASFNQPQQTLLNNKNALNGNMFIGDYQLNLGNYTQAIRYYDKVLNIDPKYENALELTGEALDYLGNYTQAIQILDKALTIKPHDKSALNYIGYALNGLGKYKEAIIYLDKATDRTNSKWLYYNKAYALNGLGKYKEAIIYLDKALDIDPSFVNAVNLKNAVLDSLGNATKFQKYENSTYGVKMQYPSDWRVDGTNYSARIVALFYPQIGNESYVAVQIGDLTTSYTPDQYLNSVMRAYKDFPDIRFNKNTTNNIVLSGHPGYLLNGTFRYSGIPVLEKFTNIGTIIGDKAYHVIYYSPAYTYPVYLPTFTQMIKSFEVIPQKISSENAAVR